MTRHGEPDEPDRCDVDVEKAAADPAGEEVERRLAELGPAEFPLLDDEPETADPGWEDLGVPPSAAEIKASFTAASPGWVYLESLAADEMSKIRHIVRGVARHYNVDHDDLLQELQLGLRRCVIIDQGRGRVRSWLRQRANWTALTMLRTGRRRPTVPFDEITPDPPAQLEVGLDHDWTVERFRGLGLNRDQAQNVLLVAWDIDISMQDYASAIERSYAKVRKDRSRALGQIKDLFELTDDEEAALVAYRRFGSIAAAATRLNRSVETVRCLVADAEQKIDRALSRPPAAGPSGDEEDTDA